MEKFTIGSKLNICSLRGRTPPADYNTTNNCPSPSSRFSLCHLCTIRYVSWDFLPRVGLNICIVKGTGKTLSYLLPIFHCLKAEECRLKRAHHLPNRPRAIVVVPNRELAVQVEVCLLLLFIISWEV